ncbi:alpha/beta hydrolase [Vogesella sp. LIG4]|uniref:alpha/beta hydrolase n=1 Tax=Vogesella sp. LIG4 TaxID=1192162 RepID=UPI00081FC42C|nr:alpha/beta hydrolase [Vogesella sp. LIG4]SCK29543.1 Acetyl esterase/lipase [Vogesella sp. LIG4]
MADLHPAVAAWLARVNAAQAERLAAGWVNTPIGAREALAALIGAMLPPGPALPWVNEAMVEGGDCPVPLRIYHPAPDEARPVLVYCHGGGHMAGSVSSYDPVCRRLAASSGHIVVAVEYRLAPENPYPAALDDVALVLRQLWPVLDAAGVRYRRERTLGGDSGGAALAATLAQRGQHDPELACDRLLLIYPSVDYTLNQPSIQRLGQGYLLEAERIGWYFGHYFRLGGDRVAASPLHGEITASHPPTLLITAGFDPLLDEGEVYARKLAAAGVAVDYHCEAAQIHAFMLLEALLPEVCAANYQRIAGFLQR